MAYRGRFDIDYVKEIMVPALFPSEEDGNPDNYIIKIDYATNQIVLEEITNE